MGKNVCPEPIIEPELPIIDAHHHLWVLPQTTLSSMEKDDSIASRMLLSPFRRYARYLLDEFLEDLATGHLVRATVFVEALAMYRTDGPKETRSIGEVEFVNGVAAMSASGLFGATKVCAGIVGNVDLTLGEAVESLLEAQIRAGGDRYRGVRCSGVVHDPDPIVLGKGVGVPQRLMDPNFRAGFSRLHRFGLSFEAWVLEPQLPQVIDLARAFPDTQIILNHVGAPVGVGPYTRQREERFPIWRGNILNLAVCPNVTVKLGGLGIPFGGFNSYLAEPPATSEQLAKEWAPYIETCIEAFGTSRCMFESNFPVDSATCSYPVLWNTFKRLAAGCSKDEKHQLFSGTANRTYRLGI